MATKYFNDTVSADGDYNNDSNWFLGAGQTGGGTTRGGVEDDVIFETSCYANSGAAASVNTLVCENGTFLGIDATVAAGATFNNTGAPSFLGTFTLTGDATFNDGGYVDAGGVVTGAATFNDTSYNSGSVNDGAVFNDVSFNNGIVYGGAVFNDSSYNNVGTVSGGAVFNGTSYNNGGTVSNGAVFNDSSYNSGTVNGGAVFNNSSYNNVGTVSDGAVFNDSSYNSGAVNDGAVFNNSSYNTNNANVYSSAVFNNSSYNDASNVYGGAVFNDSSYNNGTGAVYGVFNGFNYAESIVAFLGKSSNAGTVECGMVVKSQGATVAGSVTAPRGTIDIFLQSGINGSSILGLP